MVQPTLNFFLDPTSVAKVIMVYLPANNNSFLHPSSIAELIMV
jgi:hypothetical protein